MVALHMCTGGQTLLSPTEFMKRVTAVPLWHYGLREERTITAMQAENGVRIVVRIIRL